MVFCGWDWGATQHGVCVIDDAGQVLWRDLVPHRQASLTAVFDRLAGLADPGQLPVAIERGEGLLVGMIADAGHPVLVADPAGFKAARPRWGPTPTKSDLADAFMLADYARTDGHRLRRYEPVAPATREISVLARARTGLVAARTAASNQLWALLSEYWPGAAGLFAKLTSKIALAFLTDYPTPQSAARLGEQRMTQFCRRHHYNGQRSPAELTARLRSAPTPAEAVSPVALEAAVHALVAQIRVLNTEIATVEDQTARTLQTHPKTALLSALPRTDTVSLAQLIGEVGPILDRCATVEQAAALCGVVPVTRASGKVHTVGFRYACHKPARVALTGFADNSRHASPWAAQRYQQARDRGARHPHAVRIVARTWLRVLWVCWHTNTAYDPEAHHAQRRARAGT